MVSVARVPALLALTVAAALGGCGLPAPQYFSEEPPGSQNWAPIPAVPGWVAAPPARDGVFRIVVEGRSNARSVAASAKGLPRRIHRHVEAALAPVVGADDAARAATAAGSAAVPVHRVSKDEVLTRELVPGNTLSTVWTLCEVPLDVVLAPLPEQKRAAARAALAR